MQKHYRGNTVLIELLIVILFFALSAVIAMGLFVTAQERSRQGANTTDALIVAQDLAEKLVGRTDGETVLEQAGFEADAGEYTRTQAGNAYRATLSTQPYDAGTLYTWSIRASARGETLLTIPVAYYVRKEGST